MTANNQKKCSYPEDIMGSNSIKKFWERVHLLFKYGRMRPLIFALILFVIFMIGGMMIRSEKQKVAALQDKVIDLSITKAQLLNKKEKLEYEISIAETDEYIIAKAREYGYMMPGELLFVIKNPEALEDPAEPIQMYVVEGEQ